VVNFFGVLRARLHQSEVLPRPAWPPWTRSLVETYGFVSTEPSLKA
jgi:hypothetical protein